ncbi:MAG: hypothetical protein WCS89_02335 [Candidatus Paceibacterota bacterium]
MRKTIGIGLFLFSVCFLNNVVLAQTTQSKPHTLADYGLTEESVRYLSPERIKRILDSKTPKEIEAESSSLASTSVYQEAVIVPKDSVNCFDYYRFGSVQTDIVASSPNAVSGMIMQFSGAIRNNNDYPVVGGTLYVKIFKVKGVEKDVNGPDVIDQFVAMDNIVIPAKSSIQTSFSWPVPLYVRGGDYRIASFFVTDKKFNLLGLSFTDDVVGNSYDFKISNVDSSVYFDKSAVFINDRAFAFAAFPPRIEDKDSANVSVVVANTTNKDETVEVKWNLYRWDAMSSDNFIRATSTKVFVKAKSFTKTSLVVPDKEFPVYYLVTELKYRDTRSILNIRFVRSGVDRIRLNFPSVMQFPIIKGATSTMFSCLHNSGTAHVVQNGKLTLEVKDKEGKIVDIYTYEGGVTGSMMALKKDFISKDNLDKFSLTATLWQAGKLVDKSTIVYDCNIIDPTKCNKNNTGLVVTVIAFILLVLIAIGYVIHRRRVAISKSIFILLLLPLGFMFTPSVTEAKETMWTDTKTDVISNMLYYYWDRFGGSHGWGESVKGRTVQIKYRAKIFTIDTNGNVINEISDRASIPAGTKLRLRFSPHLPTDIFWFGMGYTMDSPYGEWNTNADPGVSDNNVEVLGNSPQGAVDDWDTTGRYNYSDGAVLPTRTLGGCSAKDYVEQSIDPYGRDWDAYIPLVIAPPTNKTVTINGTSYPLLSDAGGYYADYTITNGNVGTGGVWGTWGEPYGYGWPNYGVSYAGGLDIKFNFGSTIGKFYYRYYDFRNGGGSYNKGCYGNNIPLSFGGSFVKTPYVLEVPSVTVRYMLDVGSAPVTNNPPTIPTIVGPTTGFKGITYTFFASSTDPDGDQVRYKIDWDSDGNVDQILPSSGNTNSGTTLWGTKAWSTNVATGNHSFKVMAYDEHDMPSVDWGTYTINLSDPPLPPVPEVSLTANDLYVLKDSFKRSLPLQLTWLVMNKDVSLPTSCEATAWPNTTKTGLSISGNVDVGDLTNEETTYSMTCVGPGGTSAPATVTIYAYGSDISVSLSANPTKVTLGTTPGNKTKLTWSSENTTSCLTTYPWPAVYTAVSGSVDSNALLSTTTFSIKCGNPVAKKETSVEVGVIIPPSVFSLKIGTTGPNADKTSFTVKKGYPFGLKWKNTLDPKFDADTSKGYKCVASIPSVNGSNWDDFGGKSFSDLSSNGDISGMNTPIVGTFDFKITCTYADNGNNDIQTSLVKLNVTSSSGGER